MTGVIKPAAGAKLKIEFQENMSFKAVRWMVKHPTCGVNG